LNGAQCDKRLRLESKVICDAGRDVAVQTAIWAGDDVKFFAQIQDICRESREGDKKDNEKQRFPFMKRSKRSHERFSSHFLGRGEAGWGNITPHKECVIRLQIPIRYAYSKSIHCPDRDFRNRAPFSPKSDSDDKKPSPEPAPKTEQASGSGMHHDANTFGV
jgi:hypothetical protein